MVDKTIKRKWHIMTGAPGTMQERPFCSGSMKNYRGIRPGELDKWQWADICSKCLKGYEARKRRTFKRHRAQRAQKGGAA